MTVPSLRQARHPRRRSKKSGSFATFAAIRRNCGIPNSFVTCVSSVYAERVSLLAVGLCLSRWENCAMSKRSSKSKRRGKSLPALGFAGVSLSMASGACASTSEASTNTPPTSQSHEIFLGEEEIADVSLATFYVFDKENAGAPPLFQHQRLAFGGCHGGCGCGGCHVGCGGCGGVHVGCGGCHVGCRGCRCGGFFFRGCAGCVACGGCGGCGGSSCWIWTPARGWVYFCWSGSAPPEVSRVASEQVAQTAEATESADGNRTK
jgi:hypothetical protein